MVLQIEAILYGFTIAFLSFLYIGWNKEGKLDTKTMAAVNGGGTIVGGIILSVLFYFIMPSFVGVWWGWYGVLFLPIIIGAAIGLSVSGGSNGWILQAFKLIVVAGTLFMIILTPALNSNELYNIPQVTEIKNISAENGVFDPINIKHVRLVDQDLALSLAQTVIGGSQENLGSQFEITKDEMHIQMVEGHEYWVVPLEFQNYFKWSSLVVSPGFIMVDAENPNIPAKMYLEYKMKYMPSACWGNDLYRHVYASGYMNVNLEDFTFEVTDDLRPRWTVTTSKPTINNDGDVVESVLEINPETGAIKEHPVGQIPAWIDRVTPERIALKYATWRGQYVHGWGNANLPWEDHEDVNEVTTVKSKDGASQEMFFIYGSDNKPYWFAGMTSPSYSDQSLTSMVLVDARDPIRMIKVPMTGANEQAALDVVNTAVSNFKDWYGTALIPYNIYGVLTYIIPVDAHTENSGNVFKGVGFVDAESKHVAFAETKEEAMVAYKKYLATKNINMALTSENNEKSLAGSVVRIGQVISSESSSYLMKLDSSDALFSVNIVVSPVVAVTNVNDRVNLTYIDTGDSVLEANKFQNDNVDVKIGKDQIELNKETAVLDQQKEENWNVQEDHIKKLEALRNE